MSPTQVIDSFALLVLLGAGSLLIGLAVPAARPQVVGAAPLLASVVAIGATLGSLYLSEGAGLEPCELCWYQRIGMYPLALLVPAAVFHGRELGLRRAAVALAIAGGSVSIYHIQLQLFPDQGASCDADASCAEAQADALGFMSIPQMALACFAMIIVLLVTDLRTMQRSDPEVSE